MWLRWCPEPPSRELLLNGGFAEPRVLKAAPLLPTPNPAICGLLPLWAALDPTNFEKGSIPRLNHADIVKAIENPQPCSTRNLP